MHFQTIVPKSGSQPTNFLGGLVRTLEVVPDNARMTACGISLMQLREALKNNNRNDGAGRLNDGEEVLVVYLPQKLSSGKCLHIAEMPEAAVCRK